MRPLGAVVAHVRDIQNLGEGATDESVLAYCEEMGACLVTRDLAIRRRPAFRAAIRRHRLGAFFIGGKERSGLEIAQQVLRAANQMLLHMRDTRRPFAFVVRPGGGKLVRLPID